ncbi:MAG: hypothetical protein AAGA37_19950 [Actinomycetota bacterium]
MKCAVPSCAGMCTTKNWLGVGDRCCGPVQPYFGDDPNISPNEPLADFEQDQLDQRHLAEAQAPGAAA